MTKAGRWLESNYVWNDLVRAVGESRAKIIWDSISRRFARGASGEVNAFLAGMRGHPDLMTKTYMAIERPILESSRKITAVIEHWF